jgi:hypothetical protein
MDNNEPLSETLKQRGRFRRHGGRFLFHAFVWATEIDPRYMGAKRIVAVNEVFAKNQGTTISRWEMGHLRGISE